MRRMPGSPWGIYKKLAVLALGDERGQQAAKADAGGMHGVFPLGRLKSRGKPPGGGRGWRADVCRKNSMNQGKTQVDSIFRL